LNQSLRRLSASRLGGSQRLE